MLRATILYPYQDNLEKVFEAEDKEFPRAKYALQREGENLLFTIEATDAVALRAITTTITKVLSVWESTSKNDC